LPTRKSRWPSSRITSPTYQILKRDAQTNEQLYQALLARVKEANIASTMVPSNVAVIDPGSTPSKPFKPKTARNLALAAFLGLTLGLGLALVMEHLDDSIKSTDDLERYCGLPSVGVLPSLSTNGAGPGSNWAKSYSRSRGPFLDGRPETPKKRAGQRHAAGNRPGCGGL
jgi:hypothetical protein